MTSVLIRARYVRDLHTQKEGYVRTQGEVGYVKNKKRSLRKSQYCQHLDLELPAFSTVREFLLFKPVVFCFDSSSKLIHDEIYYINRLN